jgi:hypothetical protein
MTGDWFWWGSKNTKDDYKKLFQLTFDHFKTKGVNNVLWCWSPDKTLDWGFYPGKLGARRMIVSHDEGQGRLGSGEGISGLALGGANIKF